MKIAIPSCGYHKQFISSLNQNLILAIRNYCEDNKIAYTNLDHGELKESIKDQDFDIIISVGFAGLDEDLIKHYKQNNIKIAIIMDDLHKKPPPKDTQFIAKKRNFEAADLLFLMYPNHFKNMSVFKDIHHKCISLPWFCPEQFINKNQWSERKSITCLTGNTFKEIYPFRHQIAQWNGPNVEVLKHPSYDPKKKKHTIVGDEYYNYLSKFQAAIVTTAAKPLNYPIAKYFEVLGCGCMGFFERTKDLDDFGFEPNKHYIPITPSNFKNVIKIENFNKEIANNGRNFIKNNHTDTIRARQIIQCLQKMY